MLFKPPYFVFECSRPLLEGDPVPLKGIDLHVDSVEPTFDVLQVNGGDESPLADDLRELPVEILVESLVHRWEAPVYR